MSNAHVKQRMQVGEASACCQHRLIPHHWALSFTGVIATTDFAVAVRDVSIAVLCGGVPKRGPGQMTKVQVMAANCAIYRDQAAALAAHAAPGVKVGTGHVTPLLPGAIV